MARLTKTQKKARTVTPKASKIARVQEVKTSSGTFRAKASASRALRSQRTR